jgi:hypothetical protein
MKRSLWLGAIGLIAAEVLLLYFAFTRPKIASRRPLGRENSQAAAINQEAPARRIEIPMGRSEDISEPSTQQLAEPHDQADPTNIPAWASDSDAERQHFLEQIRSAGPAAPTQLTEIREVEAAWSTIVGKSDAKVSLGSWRCYGGGCTMTMSYHNSPAAQSILEDLTMADATMKVPGQKFRSGPVTTATGESEVTWIFFASQGGG